MGLREYAGYIESFRDLWTQQCGHLFGHVLGGKYRRGLHYEYESAGDELVVFLHTGNPANDIYQLLCLAIALKCGWLGAPANEARLKAGLASTELAAGVHLGKVWARRTESGFDKWGVVINTAKRIESQSREGTRFRIFASDPAFKKVTMRLRNILFGPRRVEQMKGILLPTGVYEVADSFANLGKRLAPQLGDRFERVARLALEANTFDLWIHSCLQVVCESKYGCVTDENLALCRHVLRIDPHNPVALYYAAQGMRDRGDLDMAIMDLEEAVRTWPSFGDGWMELGKLYSAREDMPRARECMRQAARCGITESAGSAPQQHDSPSGLG